MAVGNTSEAKSPFRVAGGSPRWQVAGASAPKGDRGPDDWLGRCILGCQVTALRASAIRGSAFRPSALGFGIPAPSGLNLANWPTIQRINPLEASTFRSQVSAIGYLVQVFGFRCRYGVVNL